MSGSRHAKRPPVRHNYLRSGDDVLHAVAAAERSTSPSADNHRRGVRCHLPVNSRVGGSRGRFAGSSGTSCARPSPPGHAYGTWQLVHEFVSDVGQEAAQPSPSFDGGESKS